MNDAATVMGKSKPPVLGDRTYHLFPLNFDDHGDVQRWLDAQVRDPLEIARKAIEAGGFPVEIQKYMAKSSIEVAARSRILIGTHEADALLDSIEGKAELLRLSIRKGVPDFTHAQAMGLLREMDEMARAQAVAAADAMRADGDPKSPAGDGSTSPPPPEASPSTGGAGSTS
jgi:hypothetical protein